MLRIVLALALLAASCSSSGSSGDHGAQRQEFPKPNTSLNAAIRTAQQKLPEGRCIGAGMGQGGTFIVALVSSEKRVDVTIDPKDGKLLGGNPRILDANIQGLFDELSKLEHGIDGLTAVDAALAKESGYWPLAVELGRDRGLVYQVLLVQGKKAKVARVSAASGSVESIVDVDSKR